MASEIKPIVVKQRLDSMVEDGKGKAASASLGLKKSSASTVVRPVPDQRSGVSVIKSEKKVEILSARQASSLKPKPGSASVKVEVKGKETASSSSKVITKKTTVTKVREKKIYSLPGQKHDIPEERDPLRIFYESLMEQIPSSEMAEFWMMEHGLLSPERAKKAFDKKQRRQKQIRMGTPIKTPQYERSTKTEKSASIAKPLLSPTNGVAKAKKKISYSDDEHDDFTVKHKKGKG